MSVTRQVLGLPEILSSVFELLSASDASLVAATQVNTTWFDCATGFRWRKIGCQVLARVPEHRRQIYASKIQYIQFDGEEGDIHEVFKGLQFHRLRSITVDLMHPPKEGPDCLRQYIRPTLETFLFRGGDLDDDFLGYMKATCSKLRKLSIALPGPSVTPSAFLGLISNWPFLEEVSFTNMESLLSDDLFLYLSNTSSLHRLKWGGCLPPRLLTRVSKETASPFPKMLTITAVVPSASVKWISKEMSNLTHLRLQVVDSAQDVLRPMSQLKNLRQIRCGFDPQTTLSTENMVALGALTHLEKLELSCKMGGMKVLNSQGARFQNSDLEDLISGLPVLKHLSLVIEAQLSVAAGSLLSIKCPLIEDCNLLKNFDIRDLLSQAPDEKPMFPYLERLNIRRATISRNEQGLTLEESANNLLALIRKHCPKLKRLSGGPQNPFATLVALKFSQMDKQSEDK